MHLLFYPNIKKTETKSMLNRNLSLENFKTPGGHWEGQSHSLAECFGCGECGDSIALVSKLKGLNNYESALYINKLLKLGIEVKEDKSIVTTNKAKDNI